MNKIEINETAEQTSRNLIDVVCTIYLIGCIITAILGVVAWAESGFAVGGPIIIIAIISIFSTIWKNLFAKCTHYTNLKLLRKI